MMKYFLVISAGLFLIAPITQAFTARIEEFPVQYEVLPISDPEIKQEMLGELKDAPQMYEIISEVPFKLTVSIRALPLKIASTSANFGGIIIKQKEVRGVQEIARMKASESTWSEVRDSYTGLAYQNGPYFSEDMASGTYRIEISTPDNHGKYMLVVGDKTDDNGYFENLSNVATVYGFYGVAKIWMISSPYIHYPLGILLLLTLIFLTYRYQKKSKSHDVTN